MIPKRLQKGDTIGVVAPSNPIIGENKEEVERARKILEADGFCIRYAKNLFSNTHGYSSSAKEKAEDINQMFQDPEVKMIWCAKGGENSNSVFDYLEYEMIQKNPKIFCGYSDITSLSNVIYAKTGLVTFSGTNFKTIATDETSYSYQEAMKRFVEGSLALGQEETYQTIQPGKAEGILVGGNLSLTRGLVAGKYKMDFQDKILFLEELSFETGPALVSNYLYYMKQNGVFDQIKGLWLGHYEHEIPLAQIVQDVLEGEYSFPIVTCEHFGHTEKKTVIPIGTCARIDTSEKQAVQLVEKCVE